MANDKTISSMEEIPSVGAYLRRVGAEVRSMRKAVIKEIRGRYWTDVATIYLEKDGEIKCTALAYEPTEDEAAEIKREASKVKWPKSQKVKSLKGAPDPVKRADEDALFIFRDVDEDIIMVQVRMEFEDKDTGEKLKRYVPYTYWSDGVWRTMEPEGQLPLFNLDKVKDASTVFIHEGAKAAKAVQEMIEGETREAREKLKSHPWGANLNHAVHIGWIGGALNPMRTDWKQLAKAGVKRAYIVADNDEEGRSAVPKISQKLKVKTFLVQFTDEFPSSFDLADKFPEALFGSADGKSIYIGPSMRECTHPATWATDQIPPPGGKGRPMNILRQSFRGMWAYVEESDTYVCLEMPEIVRDEKVLNKMLAPFSHASDTAKLINKAFKGRTTKLCYRPDNAGLLVSFGDSSAINLHVPCSIPAVQGDPTPWLDFLQYMFPNAEERKHVRRWVATLIARPDVRMSYGLLLISEAQGIGKTTLAANVLAPLVGMPNVSFPAEQQILGGFNSWIARKRLAVVNEIYSGHSWKAYNTLKSVITDKDVEVNEKYQKAYRLENWCHIIASSNSMRALKMENDDRRWFYPEVSEIAWPRERFEEFHNWLKAGGLSIIRYWAMNQDSYVTRSERAPMTRRKKEMIEGSRSEAAAEAVAIAEALSSENPTAISMKDVVGHVRAHVQGKVFDTDYELRRSMSEIPGIVVWKERMKIAGRLQYVIMNRDLFERVRIIDDKLEVQAVIRENLRKISDFIEGEM